MQRLGSCLALFLTLACPALCQFAPARVAADTSSDTQRSAPCQSCPDETPKPASDPCDGKTCFCSPYVLCEQRPDAGADVLGLLPTAIDACMLAAPDCSADEIHRLLATRTESPPDTEAMARNLPLLI